MSFRSCGLYVFSKHLLPSVPQQDRKDECALSDQNRNLSTLCKVHKSWLIDQIPVIQDSLSLNTDLERVHLGKFFWLP